MKRSAFLLFLLIILHQSYAQESPASVCQIQTLNENGRVIARFTGTLIDKSGTVLSHKNNFSSAASARIVTKDSTFHNLVQVTSEDELTGLVTFKIDNNLSSSFSPASLAGPLEEGKKGDLYESKTYNTADKKNAAISKVQEISRFGKAGSTDQSGSKSNNGSAILSGNKIIAVLIVVPGSGKGLLIDPQRVSGLSRQNKEFKAWSSGIKGETSFNKGLNALLADDKEKALTYFTQASRSFPKSTIVLGAVGNLAYEQQNYRVAKTALTQLTELENDASAHAMLASIHFEEKNYEAAENAATQALNSGSKDPAIYGIRGRSRYQQENFTEAATDLQKYLDSNPDDPQAGYDLGNAYFRSEKYPESI